MTAKERKEREFRRRETDILHAALDLFKHKNINKITIEQIAEKAEVATGTVYKHFQSKDEIYARIIIYLNQQLIFEIQKLEGTLPFKDRLEHIIDLVWQHNTKDIHILKFLFQYSMNDNFISNLNPQVKKDFLAMHTQSDHFYLQLLKQARSKGEIFDESLEGLLFCISAAIDGAILNLWEMQNRQNITSEQQLYFRDQLKKYIFRTLTNA